MRLRQRENTEGNNNKGSSSTTAHFHVIQVLSAGPMLSTEACPQTEWAKVVSPLLVGCGAFCNVFLASFGGDDVAVKMLKPEHRENSTAQKDFVGEITLLRALSHRHLPKLFAMGKFDSSLFMVMERLSSTLDAALPPQKINAPLWTYIAAVRRWPLRRALQVALDLADVLAYCHGGTDAIPGVGIMHRDLKPDNIGFAASDGRLILFDFGLAKLVPRMEGAGVGVAPCPMTGGVGSPRYMAPEVVLSKPYTFSAEVFSWSIILWQMAAHDKPFGQLSCAGHTEGVAKGGLRPPLSKQWPESLRTLLRECWEAEAIKRPTFAELIPRLREILKGMEDGANADLEKTTGCFDQLKSPSGRINLPTWFSTSGSGAKLSLTPLQSTVVDDLPAAPRPARAASALSMSGFL